MEEGNKTQRLSIVTFNARGLRNRIKRRSIFRHVRLKYRNSIVVLQETHSTENDEIIWKSEWSGPIFFSHSVESGQGGVAMLFPVNFTGIPSKLFDCEGRVVCAKLDNWTDQESFYIIGVYGPSVDNQREKCKFLDQVRELMLSYETHNIFLAGDFNIRISSLDTDSRTYHCTRASRKLQDILSEFALEDAWRHQHPAVRRYTWRRTNPVQQSRIDYICVSRSLIVNNVTETRIDAGVLSDHSFVYLDIQIGNQRRGPGIWRYNNALLEDPDHANDIRSEIEKALHNRGVYTGVTSKGLKIEMLLSNIRVLTIRHSKKLARESRKEENELYSRVNNLESTVANMANDEQRIEYESLKRMLDDIKEKRGKTAILQSQARWMEEGEKSNRYFLRLCKTQQAQTNITTVITDDGKIIRGNKPVLDECVAHFRKLYGAKLHKERNLNAFIDEENFPRLSESDMMACEGPITMQECKEALDKMARNKAAGISGFTAEFFTFFWNDLGSMMVDYFNHAKEEGELFISHRRGILTLIPKKGNQMYLKNKRPICLLDVVYKIIAKVIASRLGNVVDKLVHKNQTGFIKGRYIGENIRLISDVIEYCQIDNVEGVLLAIDYRNAFDSVEHDFIVHALKMFNFGPDLIAWVRLLYSNALLTVKNNGLTSDWFACSRGTFQGSPLSGLLFNLVAEALAIKIRASEHIAGVEINGNEIKISQYADDTTLFLRDSASISSVMKVLTDFKNVSGLEINVQKCSIMWLGPSRVRRDSICGIDAQTKVKILGVWFSATEPCNEDNVAPVISRIRSTVNSWSQRSLTIKGRIVITKTLLASQMVYVATCSSIAQVDLKEIQSLIMKFIWRGRPPKVAHSVLRQDVKDGGLGAVDVAQFYTALRLTWITRIAKCKESPWRVLLQSRVGRFDLQDVLRIRKGSAFVERLKIPGFYKDILLDFQNISQQSPITCASEVRSQSLWYNDEIRINRKPVFLRDMYDAGIKIVDDIVDSRGSVMPFDEIKKVHPNVTSNLFTIQSITCALPGAWKTILRQKDEGMSRVDPRQITVMVNGQYCALETCKCHHFYKSLSKVCKPAAVSRWEYYGVRPESWREVYEIPYKCTRSTRLQSLHFRITNRYIPTRRYLCTRGVIGSPRCLKCFEIDDFEHFFFGCSDVKTIWDKIISQLKSKYSLPNSFNTYQSVILGNPAAPPIVNLILLLTKQYIVNSKLSTDDRLRIPQIACLKGIIWRQAQAEKIAAKNRNKMDEYREKWRLLLDEEGNVTIPGAAGDRAAPCRGGQLWE